MNISILLFFGLTFAISAIGAEIKAYCPPISKTGFSSKMSCLKSVLSSKISGCTNLNKVKQLNYQITSCSYLGYARVPGNSFYLCENTLKRAKDEFRGHYSKEDNREEISDYLFEATTFYTMVHESLHLEGRDHSSSMDSEVEGILSCAGIESVFSSYGVFEEWTKNIRGSSVSAPSISTEKYYPESKEIPGFQCEVTDDGFNFCQNPYELQLKSLSGETSEEICLYETNEVKKIFKRAGVKVLNEEACGFFKDSKDWAGVFYSSFKINKKIQTSKINVLSPEWEYEGCETTINKMKKKLITRGFKILQVTGCYGRSIEYQNTETSMEEFLIRYVN